MWMNLILQPCSKVVKHTMIPHSQMCESILKFRGPFYIRIHLFSQVECVWVSPLLYLVLGPLFMACFPFVLVDCEPQG